MRQLWAPWRGEYILGEKDKGCIFCDAPRKEPKDSLLLFDGSLTRVMLNKFPYNNGHLLISPARHVARLEDMTPEESIDIFRILRHCTISLNKAMKPEGYNVGMNLGAAAGAGIEDHLHMHVVPRWNGDTNFMPVFSEIKVMPEHLQMTLLKLSPYFERI